MVRKVQEKIYNFSKKYGDKIGLDLPYFVKNGFWVMFRQGIGTLCGLMLSIAFARIANQEVFGQYQFILSVLSIVSILSIPGLNTSIIRSVARGYDGDYKNVVKTSFLWSLLGVPALLIVGTYYYFFQNPILGIAFMISSIFFPFFYAPNTWDSFLQGKKMFNISSIYGIFQSLINDFFTILIIFINSENLLAIIAIYLASYSFFNGLYYFKSLKYISNDKMDNETISYGWFLTKINVLSLIANNIDKIIVGIFLGPEKLAVYFLGITIAKIIFDLSKATVSVFSPKISTMNTAQFKKYFVIFIILVPIAILFFFLLPLIIPVLFSQKYASSVGLSQIAILFLPFVFINLFYLSHNIYFVKNKKIITSYTLLLAISKIIMMIPLLIFFQIEGLAFLFGFQTVLSFLVLLILTQSRLLRN